MHSVEELGTNVPAFLAKLWKMVEDAETNDLICWSPGGASFFIRDQARFARELLPLYYKHNNMASFVRQLNMYGFHKVVSIESGGLKVDRDEMEFAHQCFLMGHPYLVEHIKRKIPTNKSDDGRSGSKPELVNKVLSEVKTMKGRQDNVDSQLSAMKRENEVLWREVAILRQKHIKQQQIVNKLIQFLVSMVQTSRGSGIGIKRHYPLMLSDITHHSNKTTSKMNGNISEVNTLSSNSSPTGPVIHELDPTELLDAPSMEEDESTAPEFLASDFCAAAAAVGNTSKEPSASTATTTSAMAAPNSSKDDLTTDNATGLNDPNADVLLGLTEECPISPGVVLIPPSGVDLFPELKQNKGKQKCALKGSKRRKSRVPSAAKSNNPSVTVKTERNDTEDPVNVNNFLEMIMLPNLVADPESSNTVEAGSLDTTLPEEVVLDALEKVVEVPDEQRSLDEATDAAISAISSVAAQSAAAAAVPPTSSTDLISARIPVGGKLSATAPAPLGNNQERKNTEDVDVSNSTGVRDLTLACPNADESLKCIRDDLDAHVDTMQTELDSLKELLKGEAYSLDANMLLGVCAAGLGLDANTLKLFGDESLSYGIPLVQDAGERENKQNGLSDSSSGNELMTYQSNLLDLADMSDIDNWGSPIDANVLQDDSSADLSTPIVMINSPGFSGSPSKKRKFSK